MEHFLAQLPAERVFHAWGNEPKPEIHARRVARTTGNLELAVRYLRAKLYSIGLVEAIARSPAATCRSISSWAGTKAAAVRPGMQRIELFLPHLGSVEVARSATHRLLSEGRASESRASTPGRRRRCVTS